jgi:hypothetical protein
VDRYIMTRSHAVSDANRLVVEAGIERYPGRFPTSRMRLERFLDRYLGVSTPQELAPAMAYYAAPRYSDDERD